jgi:NAD(P)-dependent dehydrogenase (short-subunit alcohol dehydrogenase family)
MADIGTRPMAGKTILVMGGTGGIGKATAEGCARLGARVGVAGRDRQRAGSAATHIKARTGGAVDVFIADMSSMAEVRRLTAEVLNLYPRLDVLINNADGPGMRLDARSGRRPCIPGRVAGGRSQLWSRKCWPARSGKNARQRAPSRTGSGTPVPASAPHCPYGG